MGSKQYTITTEFRLAICWEKTTVSLFKRDFARSIEPLMDCSIEADETLTVLLIPALTCPFGSTLPDVNIERGALHEPMTKYISIRSGKQKIDFICILS